MVEVENSICRIEDYNDYKYWYGRKAFTRVRKWSFMDYVLFVLVNKGRSGAIEIEEYVKERWGDESKIISKQALSKLRLKIKPKILVKDGKMDVAKKYMGNINNCLIKYVEDTLNGNNPEKTVAFCTHSSPMEISSQICQKLRDFGFSEVYDVNASSTISSHCGPGTLGILFMNKE